jgi:hypothetical protein
VAVRSDDSGIAACSDSDAPAQFPRHADRADELVRVKKPACDPVQQVADQT